MYLPRRLFFKHLHYPMPNWTACFTDEASNIKRTYTIKVADKGFLPIEQHIPV